MFINDDDEDDDDEVHDEDDDEDGICLRFVMSLVRTTVRSRLLVKISPAKNILILAMQ